MKGLTAAALFVVSAAAASAANITITNAYPSDIQGNPVAVQLGESFYLTAKLNVDAPLRGAYRVKFDLPYATRTSPDVDFQGQATVAWGPFTALLADGMTAQVTVQTAKDSAGQPLTIQIQPALPGSAVEYYSPQTLTGRIGASARRTGGNPLGLQWYSPVPTSDGFQQVLFASGQGMLTQSQPYGQTVLSTPRRISTEIQFSTLASSSRVNPNLLRQVGFQAYTALPASVSSWLGPETRIQSNSTDVAALVSAKLPSKFRSSMTPYDTAQKLFQATVAKIQYVETSAQPDAVTAVRTGRGDCGYFSALFVAACRNAGIPARTVCGMTAGENAWHVWAEFYIPTYGWIPADPSYCDALCPDGSLPLYFGTIPELNERAAVTYGFDHVIGRTKLPMLQSPAMITSRTTRVADVQPVCSLRVSGIAP